MKRRIAALIIIPALLLSGCGKKKAPAVPTPVPVITEETAVTPVPVPVIYNSIDDLSNSARKELREELLAAADACAAIYRDADKGSTYNVILSEDTVNEMVAAIAALGYPAIDYDRNLDLQCAQPLLDFGYSIYSADDISGTYYEVYPDGQITAYKLMRTAGEWNLITMSVDWDKKAKPNIYTEGKYDIQDVQFTAKGWLIYNRDYSSFDNNQKSNSDSYVFLRVKPYDPVMKRLCETYIEPIGYLENNLFITSWNESYFTPIDFNCLYASLFARYNGTEPLTAYNAMNYYQPVDSTALFLVPTQTFESTVQYYFNIDAGTLRSISDYSYTLYGYLFLGYDKDYYNVTPRTPVPEVVDYWYNSDGTLTMRVDAINMWYGTDCAFTHEVTVREEGNGVFKYVSNTLYTSENNILPELKLGYLLDVERGKTKY